MHRDCQYISYKAVSSTPGDLEFKIGISRWDTNTFRTNKKLYYYKSTKDKAVQVFDPNLSFLNIMQQQKNTQTYLKRFSDPKCLK